VFYTYLLHILRLFSYYVCLHDSVTLCVPECPAVAIVSSITTVFGDHTVPTVPPASTFPTVHTDPADPGSYFGSCSFSNSKVPAARSLVPTV